MRLLKYIVFHPLRAATVLVLGAGLGFASFYAFQLMRTFEEVAVEVFNPEDARAALIAAPPPETDWRGGMGDEEVVEPSDFVADPRDRFPNAFGQPIADQHFDSYLLIGTDASGFLADSIIYALQPAGGGAPIMVSIPRDLYVWNLCKGRFTRINEGLGGCRGKASGSELMAIMVEDYTGIPVDHLARIDFDGFARVVDLMGGIRVCVDRPTRDIKAHLEITEPGCQTVGGTIALAWVRSRHGEELVGEEWKAVPSSDFTRQGRQQDVLFQLAGKAASFTSPGALANRLAAVSRAVRLDSSWSFGDAVSAAWRYRGIRPGNVVRFSIDTRNLRSPEGAAVLTPTSTFTEQLAGVIDLGSLLEREA